MKFKLYYFFINQDIVGPGYKYLSLNLCEVYLFKDILWEWLIDLLVRLLFVSIKTKAVSCLLLYLQPPYEEGKGNALINSLTLRVNTGSKSPACISKKGNLGWFS